MEKKPDFKVKAKEYAQLIKHCGPLLIEACELDFEAGCNFTHDTYVTPLQSQLSEAEKRIKELEELGQLEEDNQTLTEVLNQCTNDLNKSQSENERLLSALKDLSEFIERLGISPAAGFEYRKNAKQLINEIEKQ